MTKNDPKSVTYLSVEEEFSTFFYFSLFSQQMAEKIGNEMQTQGIKMKRPAIPTKVCRFPSHNCRLKSTYWNLLCMILQSWTSLHFLTHRKPTLQIWHHSDPFPHPSLVKEQKYFSCTLTLFFFWGGGVGKGKYVEWTVLYRDVFWN